MPNLRKSLGTLTSASIVAMALLFAGAGPVAAATLVVDEDGLGSAANCDDPTVAHATIQAAVDAAVAGDTISVCPGLYPELAGGPLTINKQLTLLGAQAGVDARGARGAESVISDASGTSVSASGVVINGFSVENSISSAFTGYGIWMNPGISGTQILNNIIQNNIVGIGLANAGPSQAVIRQNLIRNNILPGGASGSGIYTDQFVGGPIVRNVLVDQNAFVDHSGFGAAINISNEAYVGGGVFDLTVSANTFATNSRAFVLFNTHTSTFTGNTVTGSTFASADVRLFDNNTDLLFTNNNFSGGVGHAIRFSVVSGGGPSSNVDFHENNIEAYGLSGMTVDPLSHTGIVDAECNWWNSPSGPTAATNPGGTGEEVIGDVDFDPWLVTRDGACVVVNEPGDRDDCKDGGWMTRTRADGSTFKNQGDCVSYLNSGKH